MQRIHDIQFQCIAEHLECILLSESCRSPIFHYYSMYTPNPHDVATVCQTYLQHNVILC